MQITPEVLKEIKACKSVDELIEKAAGAGIELPQTQAEELLESAAGDLDLEALDAVAGGAGCYDNDVCPYCKSEDWIENAPQHNAFLEYQYFCNNCRKGFDELGHK